jgi:hypothetical protein
MFVAIAAVAFGYHAWPLFIDALADRASTLSEIPEEAAPLVSVFGSLRMFHVSPANSWIAQLAVTAIAAVTVCGLWARPIPHSLKAAAPLQRVATSRPPCDQLRCLHPVDRRRFPRRGRVVTRFSAGRASGHADVLARCHLRDGPVPGDCLRSPSRAGCSTDGALRGGCCHPCSGDHCRCP